VFRRCERDDFDRREFYGRHGFLIVGPGSTTKRDVIIPDMTPGWRASSRSVD
jgi:hypothetical protein